MSVMQLFHCHGILFCQFWGLKAAGFQLQKVEVRGVRFDWFALRSGLWQGVQCQGLEFHRIQLYQKYFGSSPRLFPKSKLLCATSRSASVICRPSSLHELEAEEMDSCRYSFLLQGLNV